MPQVKNVEDKIFEFEGFKAKFEYNGKDVPGKKKDMPQYDYKSAATKTWTVAEWTKKRFKQKYPGYDVQVLDAEGNKVVGHSTLETVRKTYVKD